MNIVNNCLIIGKLKQNLFLLENMLLPKFWIICRVCLKQHEDLVNIFENVFNDDIWILLRDCGGVPVRKNDDLPDKICEECLGKLWKAVNFRNDCQRGHRDLVQMSMERSAVVYKIELEDENENCSEFITIPSTNDDFQTIDSLIKLNQSNSTNSKENEEYIASANSLNTTIEHNVIGCNVITETEANEQYIEKSVTPQEENPNVLLIELNSIPEDQKLIETNGIETYLKISVEKANGIETDAKTSPQKINATVTAVKPCPEYNISNDKTQKVSKINSSCINEEAKTKCKANRTKSKAIVKTKIKPQLKKRNSDFTCKVCKKPYGTPALLRHHMYIHKKPHQCKICHKRFGQIMEFVSHNNQHTGIKPYYCRTCFKTFADITNRNSHERKRHKKLEFKCEQCDKVFRLQDLLQKHVQSHRPKKCFICNKEFSSLHMVRAHHQYKHLKLKK